MTYVLVGTGSLLVQCAEILERRRHRLAAIVTRQHGARSWADERSVPVFQDPLELANSFGPGSIDVLLSIGHLRPVPTSVLQVASRAAVNFHDGPLPSYAGLNVPAWAIIRGEQHHAITWHLMVPEIDAGRVLVRRAIPVTPGETAFTLNAKCYAAGLESFEELLDLLEQGNTEGTEQVGTRHVFLRKDRPDGVCGIDWTAPAGEISALVRGLDFGPYPNPIGLATGWWGETPLFVVGVQVTEARSGRDPGTVVEVDHQTFSLATGTQDVTVNRVRLADGRLVSGGDAARILGLRPGIRLMQPSEAVRAAWRRVADEVASHEDFWIQRLGAARATAMPLRQGGSRPTEPVELPFAIPVELERIQGVAGRGDLALGITIASLTEVLGRARLDFKLRYGELPGLTTPARRWFASEVPVVLTILPGESTRELVTRMAEALREVRGHGTYPLDLVWRHPELRGIRPASDDLIAVTMGAEDFAVVAGETPLTIWVNETGTESRWFVNPDRLDLEIARAWRDACERIVRQALADPDRSFGARPVESRPRIRGSYSLSPTQAGMLYHHIRAPGSGVDHEQIVGTLAEPLEPLLFERAWRAVASRHDVLRTAFRWEDTPEPMQQVHAAVTVPFQVNDWRGLTPVAQLEALEEYLERDRTQGFDLRNPPLFRVALFRTAEANWRMVWSLAHIIMDGRSFPLVLREVFEAYEGLRRGSFESPTDQPIPYSSFITWLEGRDVPGDRTFWRSRLQDVQRSTPIPGEPQGDSTQRTGTGVAERRLSRGATHAIQTAGERHDFRTVTAVLGAWGAALGRFTGNDDVLFGAARSCRRGSLGKADRIVGLLVNTLPVRVPLPAASSVADWLHSLRQEQAACRAHEHAPLLDVQQLSGVRAGRPLFETLVVYDEARMGSELRRLGGGWHARDFELRERTGFPLTLHAFGEQELVLQLSYERNRIGADWANRLLNQVVIFLETFGANPDLTLGDLPLLPEMERQVVTEWNETARPLTSSCIHDLIAAQAAATPDRIAVRAGAESLTYSELEARSNQLAHELTRLGVGPEVRVGLATGRDAGLVVGLLGILKAGGAYVPLDPGYPAERLAYMLEDSSASVVVTDSASRNRVPPVEAVKQLLVEDRLEGTSPLIDSGVGPENLAYVMYTSGSTGPPKGVMVEHRQVVNFFAAMDERIGAEPGTWLSVTSPSFDISVLELCWTLSRGFTLVIAATDRPAALVPATHSTQHPISFSLFYFASGETGEGDKYRLLLEGAKFADRHGFEAVWTPERHFHAFGGLYPNPAVAGAALAAVTERIGIRAGSVVLPLHHPIRVAEEWALVDNLSGGRVGISFASGWQPNDFVLRPDAFSRQKEIMLREIETVRRLWRGEALPFPGPKGEPVEVRTLPRPVQQELPFWITTAGNPDSFDSAGRAGARLLTHLLGQSVEELATKLERYRRAWRDAGHPGNGHVTLMLHTFVGDDEAQVRELVRKPLIEYLRSSVSLIRHFAWAFPTFRNRPDHGEVDLATLSTSELDALLDHAFDRYFETSGLFGTAESCRPMVNRLRDIGVDEIACLIDFGVPTETALGHLNHLQALHRQVRSETIQPDHAGDASLAGLLTRYQVTHLQCTPVLARHLAGSPEARGGLSGLRRLLVGGEALPATLGADLTALLGGGGEVHNMYGPTETTIWSTTHLVGAADSGSGASSVVPLGRPILNTRVYVLDESLRPVPLGVAGELWIAGAGVARGYLGRPELTAERFRADPFGPPGDRMYRTGDLVRWRSDGVLDFLGRLDNQVKIRGFRIEPGEIEAAIREVDGVADAVVVARNDGAGDDGDEKRLVAFIEARNGHGRDTSGLRDRLRQTLPEHMVPAQFVWLESLPLTPNGKVDRQALPSPTGEQSVSAPPSPQQAVPRSSLEKAIAGVWCEALRVPAVGLDDNFFDLGGHSLLAVQAHRRLKEALGREVAITALFEFPTVRALAAHLGGEGREALSPTIQRAEGRRDALARRAGARRRRTP